MTPWLRILLLWFALLPVCIIQAQSDESRWAINYTTNILASPVPARHSASMPNKGDFGGFSVMGEYSFAEKWTAELGYFLTEVHYNRQVRTMEGLQGGVKRYFLNERVFFQPYLAARGQVNWRRRFEQVGERMNASYTAEHRYRNPLLSFAPGVGADIYLFSSVAFTIRYDFMMGIDSRTTIEGRTQDSPSFYYHDKGMYHQLGLGVKVTFPFRFSEQDGESLLYLLLDMLFWN